MGARLQRGLSEVPRLAAVPWSRAASRAGLGDQLGLDVVSNDEAAIVEDAVELEDGGEIVDVQSRQRQRSRAKRR